MDEQQRRHKAEAHPIRRAIMNLLEAAGEPLSPGALAGELQAPLGVVSYHVRMLRGYGMVELVRTVPRRGALEHFYARSAVARAEPASDVAGVLRARVRRLGGHDRGGEFYVRLDDVLRLVDDVFGGDQ